MSATSSGKVVPAPSDLVFTPFAVQVAARAAAAPGRAAIVCDGKRENWGELVDRVSRAAARLVAAGLEPNDTVAIMAHTAPAYVEAFLAVLHAGGCVVPLPTMASPEAVSAMIADAAPRALFADAAARGAMGARFEVIDIRVAFDFAAPGWQDYEAWLAAAEDGIAPVPVAPEDGFNIIYSSGTTGVPKGIVQSNLMRAYHIARQGEAGFDDDPVTIVATPLYSNTTLVALIPTLAAGGTLVLMRKFDVEGFLSLCERERVSHAMLVPVQYERILAHPAFERTDLSAFRHKYCTSAILRAEVAREIVARWPGGMLAVYGLTEGGPTCFLDCVAHPDKLHTVGVPSENVELHLLDEAGNAVAPGEIGEIVGRSPAMMSGYRNRDDLTDAMIWRDAEGRVWFRTGDLGRIDADGFVELMDRKKDMIISGGFNIYASDLESALLAHPAVREAAVIGVPSREWGETPLAVVALKAGAQARAEDIRAHANARLGKLQRISEVIIRDALPRSSIGKVLKRELAAPHWEKRSSS